MTRFSSIVAFLHFLVNSNYRLSQYPLTAASRMILLDSFRNSRNENCSLETRFGRISINTR